MIPVFVFKKKIQELKNQLNPEGEPVNEAYKEAIDDVLEILDFDVEVPKFEKIKFTMELTPDQYKMAQDFYFWTDQNDNQVFSFDGWNWYHIKVKE